MVWTAGDVATQSLKEIMVEAADAAPEASEYADFLDALNNFMSALESDGIKLGYTTVDNVADEVTIPAGAIRGLIANMAIEIAPQYQGKVTAPLVLKARTGLDQMRRIGRIIGQTTYPATMPYGAGNNDATSGDFTSPFFRQVSSTLLSIAGNTKATSIETAGTNVKLAGFWTVDHSEGLSADITGRITNTLNDAVTVTFTAALTLVADASITGAVIALYQSGASAATTTANLSTTATDVTLTSSLTLERGEYVEIYVGDPSSTTNITVQNGTFETS